MQPFLSIQLPLPPSLHNKTKARELYRNALSYRVTPDIRQFIPTGVRFAFTVRFYANFETSQGKPRRKDTDNLCKVLQDELFRALDIDDKWVWETRTSKHHVADGASVHVILGAASDLQALGHLALGTSTHPIL